MCPVMSTGENPMLRALVLLAMVGAVILIILPLINMLPVVTH